MHGEQLLGHVAQRLLDAALGPLPGLPAEPVDARRVAVGAGIALDQVEAVHRHEEARVVRVLDAQELALDAAQLELDQAAVDPDAVVGVHQVVAGAQVPERLDGHALGPGGAPAALLARPEDLLLGHHGELQGRQREALGELRHAHLDAARARPAPGGFRLGGAARLDAVLGEQVPQALGLRERAAGEDRAPALLAPLLEAADEGGERRPTRARFHQRPAQLVVTARAQHVARHSRGAVFDLESLELERAALAHGAHEVVRRQRQRVGR